jgi:hypothetical protein
MTNRPPTEPSAQFRGEVRKVLARFTQWLEGYGEVSYDHQSFFAGPIGGRAKALYYRHKLIGTMAVAPMIFCEALVPSARRLFHHKTRFPIADAHYAMGFGKWYECTGDRRDLDRGVHFLDCLKKSRCPGFKEYGWGYPFDWVTRGGVIKTNTPLITSTPYVFEAFHQIYEQTASLPWPAEQRAEWKEIMASTVRHACTDIKDFTASPTANTCSYTPDDQGGVINASAYRGFLLTSASKFFAREEYWRIAERNLNFVLENQNADGSWYYAVDGVRDFVDHFHTCFVMKALAKIHSLTGHPRTLEALARGVKYYVHHLFDTDGLPKPFSRAPRLTVYKRELYDCAEAVNLCLLLRDRFPELGPVLESTVGGILRDWVKPDGSFRARQLKFGWDNVPMHRWAQSQMFRALAFYCI